MPDVVKLGISGHPWYVIGVCSIERRKKKTISVPYFLDKFHDLLNLMTSYMIQMAQNSGSHGWNFAVFGEELRSGRGCPDMTLLFQLFLVRSYFRKFIEIQTVRTTTKFRETLKFNNTKVNIKRRCK